MLRLGALSKESLLVTIRRVCHGANCLEDLDRVRLSNDVYVAWLIGDPRY